MSAVERSGTEVHSQPDERTLGQLVATATADLSALVHDEIALAKAELRLDAKRAGIGGGAFAAAGVLAAFAMPMFTFAAAYGFYNLGVPLAWAFVIVGVALLTVAALVGLFARSRLKKIKPPERSISSAKQTMTALQGVRPHPRAGIQDAAAREM